MGTMDFIQGQHPSGFDPQNFALNSRFTTKLAILIGDFQFHVVQILLVAFLLFYEI